MVDDKILNVVTPPVSVSIIGTSEGLVNCTTAKTPPDQPNIIIKIVSPLVAVGVRFGNTFCVSFAGSLTAGGLTVKVMPHADFAQLLSLSAFLALCIAGVGLVKDSATVFSGLEKRFPLGSGSI